MLDESKVQLSALLWQQHSDPIAFLVQVEKARAWRTVFFARLAGGVGWILLLAVFAFLNQEVGPVGQAGVPVWRQIIGYAAIAFFLLPMGIGAPIMISHHTRFWLAYWLSPPLLVIAFLCGLIAFTGVTHATGATYFRSASYLGWFAWLMLFYAIGTIVCVAGAVWVHKGLLAEKRTQAKRRAGGRSANLPHLRLWARVRWLRIGMGVISLLGAAFFFWQEPRELVGTLIMLAFGLGGLHLDAILLCWLSPVNVVKYDTSLCRWRTTYSGRFALFAPRYKIHRLLASEAQAADIVLMLLREGTLGATIRRACAKLTPTQADNLLLHLSLQTGGASAIRYLQPRLPLASRPIAERYATLATEATKSFDLQRWLDILPVPSEQNAMTKDGWEQEHITQLLTQVRQTLLAYEFTPQIDQTQRDLQHFVETIEHSAAQKERSTPYPWPVALLHHVESHRQRLIAT